MDSPKINRMGRTPGPTRETVEKAEKIKELREQGWSFERIGLRLGMYRQQAWRIHKTCNDAQSKP